MEPFIGFSENDDLLLYRCLTTGIETSLFYVFTVVEKVKYQHLVLSQDKLSAPKFQKDFVLFKLPPRF